MANRINQLANITFYSRVYFSLSIRLIIIISKQSEGIMPSYDDDLPTEQEEALLKQLVENTEQQPRIQALIEVSKDHPAKASIS